jgi:hypothetical protein
MHEALLLLPVVRRQTLNTFCTSSPKWLITLTHTRPLSGRAKGHLLGAQLAISPGFSNLLE